MDRIRKFEELLAAGTDNAMLRYTLGAAYLERGDPGQAVTHLARAVAHDPAYSAAWKAYGHAFLRSGDPDAAREAWRRGIEAAERNGDIQAAREMRVFLRRLEKSGPSSQGGTKHT